ATTVLAVTHPDDREQTRQALAVLRAGRLRSYQVEKRYVPAGGEPVWVLLSSSVVRDIGGAPLYFFSQPLDVTERRPSEAGAIRAASRSEVLAQVSRAFAEAGTDYQSVLDAICRMGSELSGHSWAVLLLDEARTHLDVVSLWQLDAVSSERLRERYATRHVPLDGLIGKVIAEGVAMTFGPDDLAAIAGARTIAADSIAANRLVSLHGIPLVVRGVSIGALVLAEHLGVPQPPAPDPDAGNDAP